MSQTNLTDVQYQIQTKWAPIGMKELREALLLGALVNKDYEGAIGKEGDTVRVSQLAAPTGELRTIGTNADEFASDKQVWSKVDIKADKRAVASFEVTDLAELQSQIGSPQGQSEIRSALIYSVSRQINDYLWSLVAPSTSNPDHLLNSKANCGATELLAIRKLAAKAKWLQDGRWYGLLNPDYYNDILSATTMVSKDYVGDEAPTVAGQIANKRFGFNLLEDNSRNSAMGLFFHPDFMHLVTQQQMRFKVSDLHSNNKFAYVVSADIVFGAKLGIDGDKKHIFQTAAATGQDTSI